MNLTDPIPITLQAQQWNVTLDQLANGPWRIVDPLIRTISAQLQAADQAPVEQPAGKPNGAAAGEVELPAAA